MTEHSPRVFRISNSAVLGLSLLATSCSTHTPEQSDDEPTCVGKCDAPDDLGEDQDFTGEPGVDECVAAIEAIPAEAIHPEGRVDAEHEEAVSDAGRTCLSAYLRVNTSNPRREGEPGETAGAHFFAGVFQKLDIPFQFTTMAGNPDLDRLSIVASLEGRQRDDSIVLLSHIDVVRADGEWTHPPFAGVDDGELIWGRGAIDMKVVSIVQLLSMAMLQKSGVELERDIHFVAVADEEVTGAGAEFVAITDTDEQGRPVALDPLDLRPGVVLNEGGTAVRDAILPGRDIFLVGVEEKGLVWTQVAADEPSEILEGLVRAGVVSRPSEAAMPEASVRETLGQRCKLTRFLSDEEQKTNIQPRTSTIRLDCGGDLTAVDSALDAVREGLEPHPHIEVTADGDEVVVEIELGAGGHGSASVGATALDAALASLVATGQVDPERLDADDVAEHFFGFALSPANEEFLGTLARVVGPITGSLGGWLAKQPWTVRKAGEHGSHLLPSDVPFRNTCSWTAFDFPKDGEARAKLDCRLIHQFGASEFENELVDFMAEANAIELRNDREHCFDCARQEFNVSPFGEDASDYQILRSVTQRSSAHAVVTPYLFPASSDSYFFRLAKVPTYGFLAAALTEAELTTFHAIDERFPVAQMFPSQKIYTETVLGMATRTAPAPADSGHSLADHMTCFERDDDLIGDDEWEERDEIECSVNPRSYYCVLDEDAPRYLRMRAEDQDVRLLRLEQLTEAFTDAEPIPEEDGPFIAKTLFEKRDDDTPLKHRLFEGNEVEVDTGTAAKRQFHVRCGLPLTVNVVDDAELQFYRD